MQIDTVSDVSRFVFIGTAVAQSFSILPDSC